jgi:predicted transposase YbfD/YdcC
MRNKSNHPEWALRYRTQGTELRLIRARYYLYNVVCQKCPDTGKWKKKTLKQVGTICEKYGLVPTGMRRRGRTPKDSHPFKEDPKLDSDFCDHFSEKLEDPRGTRNRLYTMAELLLVTLCAVLCGADGWSDVENFGRAKLAYLRRYFDYKNGVPSDDTLRRFFRCLDPEAFMRLFREWVTKLTLTVGVNVIAIDGKASRCSYDKDKDMLHTVSAFATEARIVLGQAKVGAKTNEITAIPKLLNWLDISGRIITIDAMGCQYKIADQIVKKGGDYIFSLKGNQETLAKDVGLYFENLDPKKCKSHTDCDKGHGRIEQRSVYVVNDVIWLRGLHPNWWTIKSIIKLDCIRELQGKITKETRYYVSSLDTSAEKVLGAIRNHWAIENSLHWVMDMSFGDDYSRIRKDNAPYIMTMMRQFAYNMLQHARNKHTSLGRKSIKGLRKSCGWDDELLDTVLASTDFS